MKIACQTMQSSLNAGRIRRDRASEILSEFKPTEIPVSIREKVAEEKQREGREGTRKLCEVKCLSAFAMN